MADSMEETMRAPFLLRVALLLPLGGVLLLGTPLRAEAGKPDPRQVVQKARERARLEGTEMVSTLTIVSKGGQQRVRKTAAISKLYDGGKTEKRLIRFLAPADVKGTGLLTFDYQDKPDDIWFFLPALRKTRRIVSAEKAKTFMGSEFTYADLSPPPVDDFDYTLLRSETVDGVACWVIEARPKSERVAAENGLSRRVAWFGQQDHVVRKAQTYDRKGKLHRQLSVAQVRPVEGQKGTLRPFSLTVKNVQNGRSSTMAITKLKLRKEIPAEYFTTRYLERP